MCIENSPKKDANKKVKLYFPSDDFSTVVRIDYFEKDDRFLLCRDRDIDRSIFAEVIFHKYSNLPHVYFLSENDAYEYASLHLKKLLLEKELEVNKLENTLLSLKNKKSFFNK